MEVNNNEVIIKDINMPFNSMVIFGMKWMLAMIPAIIIFYIIIFLIIGVLGLVVILFVAVQLILGGVNEFYPNTLPNFIQKII